MGDMGPMLEAMGAALEAMGACRGAMGGPCWGYEDHVGARESGGAGGLTSSHQPSSMSLVVKLFGILA